MTPPAKTIEAGVKKLRQISYSYNRRSPYFEDKTVLLGMDDKVIDKIEKFFRSFARSLLEQTGNELIKKVEAQVTKIDAFTEWETSKDADNFGKLMDELRQLLTALEKEEK